MDDAPLGIHHLGDGQVGHGSGEPDDRAHRMQPLARVVEMVADVVACMRWRERHTPSHGRMNRSASASVNGGHQPLQRLSPAAAAGEVNNATQPIVDLHLARPVGQEGGDGPQKPHHENVPFPVTSRVLRWPT